MHSNFVKLIKYCWNEIKCYIKGAKTSLLLLLIALVAGFAVGIISCTVSGAEYSSINYIVLIGKGEYNIFGQFFRILMLTAAGLSIIYLTYMSKWCSVLPHIVIFYTAYRCGIRLLYTVMADKLLGVVCIIIFVIPLYAVLLCGYLFAACIVRKYCDDNGFYRRCGRGCKNSNTALLKTFGIVFAVMSICICIFALILPLFVSVVIII